MAIKDIVEFRITLGNLLSIVVTIATVTAMWSSLSVTVDNIEKIADTVPSLNNRLTVIESRADTGKAAQEALQAEVKEQEKVQAQILQTLARIEERIVALQRSQ